MLWIIAEIFSLALRYFFLSSCHNFWQRAVHSLVPLMKGTTLAEIKTLLSGATLALYLVTVGPQKFSQLAKWVKSKVLSAPELLTGSAEAVVVTTTQFHFFFCLIPLLSLPYESYFWEFSPTFCKKALFWNLLFGEPDLRHLWLYIYVRVLSAKENTEESVWK